MTPRRFTRDEARTVLLEAGTEMLIEQGVSAGLGAVSLAEAINRSGVPRPSAYRVFGESERKPIHAFHEELMIEIARGAMLAEFSAPLGKVIHEAVAAVETSGTEVTKADLTRFLVELVRSASRALVEVGALRSQAEHSLRVLAVSADPQCEPRIKAAVERAECSLNEGIAKFLKDLLDAFGLRMRAGWDVLQLSSCLTSAARGTTLTSRIAEPTASGTTDQTGKTWTPLGTMWLGIVALATEPDPRRVVAANLASWFEQPGAR